MSATTTMANGTTSDARREVLAKLRETINRVTGAVFYGPLLRSARGGLNDNGIGRGGRGESVFQGQMDQILIERAGEASHHNLNELLFDRFAAVAIANGAERREAS
ncbi:MAG: hypothetical protein HOP29_09310 [Phycisphaerales bacterium]|nr:hypothetical protein [Phycisphaerales bacterium]